MNFLTFLYLTREPRTATPFGNLTFPINGPTINFSSWEFVVSSPYTLADIIYSGIASSSASSQVRLNYHSRSVSLTPGILDIYLQFINDSRQVGMDGSGGGGYDWTQAPKLLTKEYKLATSNEAVGWTRWEASIPPYPQLRYTITIVGGTGFGDHSELAVDNLSLSPQCFGLGVPEKLLGGWRSNMTDAEFCKYYGKDNLLTYLFVAAWAWGKHCDVRRRTKPYLMHVHS